MMSPKSWCPLKVCQIHNLQLLQLLTFGAVMEFLRGKLPIAREFANYPEKFAFYDYALNFQQASEIRNYRHWAGARII